MTLFDGPPVDEVAAPATRVRLTVAYDGRGFRGFAAQPGVRTVAGTLADAISRVLRRPVELVAAGRTDAGVHAWGQVVHFDLPAEAPLDVVALHRSLVKQLAPEIVVRRAGPAPAGFDARHSALARRYRYHVVNRELPDPFLAATHWHVATPLDVRAMQAAADPLIGEHDFSSFCRRPPSPADGPPPSLVRRVHEAEWRALADGVLRLDISASSFCHQMVRSIVGTLAEVGSGKRRAGDMTWVLARRDRSVAAQPAPPHGLCLWEVVYPPEEDDQVVTALGGASSLS